MFAINFISVLFFQINFRSETIIFVQMKKMFSVGLKHAAGYKSIMPIKENNNVFYNKNAASHFEIFRNSLVLLGT
jgi:hypothetical protein